MRNMITTETQTKENEITQHKETLEGLKTKILELTRLIEPIYNKEFWENFVKTNGNEFDSGTLLYLYWIENETEFEVEEDHVILKVHSTVLEVRKIQTEDMEGEHEGKEFYEVSYVPFHDITNVSLTTDYVK